MSPSRLAEERMAEAQGRPVRVCERCKKVGAAHWIPERLGPNNQVIPGRWACDKEADA
jgi:hypothetical protein